MEKKVFCFVDNQRKWRLCDLSVEPASVSLYSLDILMSRCNQGLRQIIGGLPSGRQAPDICYVFFKNMKAGKSRWKK